MWKWQVQVLKTDEHIFKVTKTQSVYFLKTNYKFNFGKVQF